MTADFLVEIMQAIRQWSKIFKVLGGKEKKSLDLESLPSKNIFQNKGNMYIYIQKLEQFITSRPEQQEILKDVLQAEGKWYKMEIHTEMKSTRNGNYKVKYKDFFHIVLISLKDNLLLK